MNRDFGVMVVVPMLSLAICAQRLADLVNAGNIILIKPIFSSGSTKLLKMA